MKIRQLVNIYIDVLATLHISRLYHPDKDLQWRYRVIRKCVRDSYQQQQPLFHSKGPPAVVRDQYKYIYNMTQQDDKSINTMS